MVEHTDEDGGLCLATQLLKALTVVQVAIGGEFTQHPCI